jgi:hypothetical protein
MPTDDPGWSDYIELPDLPEGDAPRTSDPATPPPPPPPVAPSDDASSSITTPSTGAPHPTEVHTAPTTIAPSAGGGRKPPWVLIVVAIVVIGGIVGGAIALTGGGGNGKSTTDTTSKKSTLSDSEWVSQANAICRKHFNILRDANVRGDYDTYVAEGQKELAEFQSLGLPPTGASHVRAMLDFLDQTLNDLGVQNFQSADAAAKSAGVEATALHLTDCVSG